MYYTVPYILQIFILCNLNSILIIMFVPTQRLRCIFKNYFVVKICYNFKDL